MTSIGQTLTLFFKCSNAQSQSHFPGCERLILSGRVCSICSSISTKYFTAHQHLLGIYRALFNPSYFYTAQSYLLHCAGTGYMPFKCSIAFMRQIDNKLIPIMIDLKRYFKAPNQQKTSLRWPHYQCGLISSITKITLCFISGRLFNRLSSYFDIFYHITSLWKQM